MTHEERLKLLQTWYEKGVALEKASDEVCKVFGVGDLDRCAILSAACNLWDAYTDAVATLAGAEVWKTTGDDVPCRSDLHWWWYENKRGRGNLKVKLVGWKRFRLIRSVDDLCRLIEADLREEGKS